MKTFNLTLLIFLPLCLGPAVYSQENPVLAVYDFECSEEAVGTNG